MARTLRMLAGGGRLVICPRSSASTAWLTKETSKHHGSTIQWRGRWNAASAASDVPNSQRGRRKVLKKDERRAALESYVNKYREANAGKFPSVSKAREEVGGGHYYTVRQVIQELKYKSKLDPPTTGLKKPTKEEPRENLKSITAGEDIPTQIRVDSRSENVAESISSGDTTSSENLRDEAMTEHECPAEGKNPDLVEARSTFLKKDDEETPYPPERQEDARSEARNDQPALMSEQHHVKEDAKEDGEEDKFTRNDAAEVSPAKAEVPKDLSDSGGPQRQEKQYKASNEPDRDTEPALKSDRDTEPPEKSVRVIEPPQRSSFWGNLKSFADDIISIWRNR